jgi:hypothetical protein
LFISAISKAFSVAIGPTATKFVIFRPCFKKRAIPGQPVDGFSEQPSALEPNFKSALNEQETGEVGHLACSHPLS